MVLSEVGCASAARAAKLSLVGTFVFQMSLFGKSTMSILDIQIPDTYIR
jgi:hypothetical protein